MQKCDRGRLNGLNRPQNVSAARAGLLIYKSIALKKYLTLKRKVTKKRAQRSFITAATVVWKRRHAKPSELETSQQSISRSFARTCPMVLFRSTVTGHSRMPAGRTAFCGAQMRSVLVTGRQNWVAGHRSIFLFVFVEIRLCRPPPSPHSRLQHRERLVRCDWTDDASRLSNDTMFRCIASFLRRVPVLASEP